MTSSVNENKSTSVTVIVDDKDKKPVESTNQQSATGDINLDDLFGDDDSFEDYDSFGDLF